MRMREKESRMTKEDTCKERKYVQASQNTRESRINNNEVAKDGQAVGNSESHCSDISDGAKMGVKLD